MSVRAQIAGAVLGAVLAVLVLLRFGISWELPAYAYMSAMSGSLGLIDLKYKLLPNRYVLPSLPIAIVLLALAALVNGTWSALLNAILGGVAMFILYLIMALITPGGIGMGDVKLAAVLGIFLGFLGWDAWFSGLFAAFLIGGLAGLIFLIAGKAKRTSTIPFGPPMLIGALITVFWGESLVRVILPSAA